MYMNHCLVQKSRRESQKRNTLAALDGDLFSEQSYPVFEQLRATGIWCMIPKSKIGFW